MGRGWRAAVPWLVGLVAAGGIGVGSALVAARLVSGNGPAARPAEPEVASDDIGHVHGLGRDPSDQRWYVATHAGLLRVMDEGRLLRVADRYQDTMGFTIAGPAEFLASGHPDLRDGLPTRLGLIRSTDAGLSWSAVSLTGEADLHAIVLTRGRLYAADASSGALLVSIDSGTTWARRADVELMALAVDPADPDRLVGISYEGASMRSGDGGRTFDALPGPSLLSVAWGTVTIGTDRDGTVYRLNDRQWAAVGTIGVKEPVLAVDGSGFAAALPNGELRFSFDGGSTWTGKGPGLESAGAASRRSCDESDQLAKSSGRARNLSAHAAEQKRHCRSL